MAHSLKRKRAAFQAIRDLDLSDDVKTTALAVAASDGTAGNSLRDLIELSNNDELKPAMLELLKEQAEGAGESVQMFMQAVLKQLPHSISDASLQSIAFSAISGGQANKLLQDVHLAEVDGFKVAPLAQATGDIKSFDFSKYVDENTGTPAFVKYHKEQLEAYGVPFGLNGYDIHDLHARSLYRVQVGYTTYSGGVDGGVVPYAVNAESATMMLRVGFQHKQSTKAKAAFQTQNNPQFKQAAVTAPKEYMFEEGRGQAICCLLAAHKMCQLPVDLDLTDGKRHHLLRLRGNQLLVYEGCTPEQAYGELANFLKTQSTLLTRIQIMTEPPEELDEEFCAPIKQLQGLGPGATFSEQAESLLSSCNSVQEQVVTAYQLAREWDFPVLDCVSRLYGA